MHEFKILQDGYSFYIGLGDIWFLHEDFGYRPILTPDCINLPEWDYWCDELIKDIKRLKKLGTPRIRKRINDPHRVSERKVRLEGNKKRLIRIENEKET